MSTALIHRPGNDPIASEIARLSIAIGEALAPAKSKRLSLARQNLVEAKDACTAAQVEFSQAVQAARDGPGEATVATALIREAAARVAMLEADRRAARAEVAGLVQAAAPAVCIALAPHLAVAQSLIEGLLSQLENLTDPLIAAKRFMTDNRIDGIPRLLASAPTLVQQIRVMRGTVGRS